MVVEVRNTSANSFKLGQCSEAKVVFEVIGKNSTYCGKTLQSKAVTSSLSTCCFFIPVCWSAGEVPVREVLSHVEVEQGRGLEGQWQCSAGK